MEGKITPVEVSTSTIEYKKGLYKRIYSGSKKALVKVKLTPEYIVSQVNAYEDAEEEYKGNVAGYNALASALNEGFDNLPSVRFDFFGAAWLMALAYGCEMVCNGGFIAAKPRYKTIDDISKQKLKPGKIYECGLYPIIRRRIQEFQKRYPQIPIAVSDNQSPIDVLTCILNSEEAMMAMFLNKEILHTLLDGITDSIIEINRYLEGAIRNFFCFRNNHGYIPWGIHLSDDDAAFISPDLYREFAVPYAARIGKDFGGLNLHCCMGYEHNLKNMSSIEGFMGFDPQRGHNSLPSTLKALENGGVWELSNYPEQHKDYTSEETWRLVADAIEAAEGKISLIINICSNGGNDQALKSGWIIKNRLAKSGFLEE